jgi:S-adenosylmethionine/arginine decarboxylase-like enzyme
MGKDFVREHKHVIVRAYVNNPPTDKEQLSEWCKNVISDVGMKVIGGPLVVHSDIEGNKGYTAVAILDFSHLAIHTWDKISPALIEFDLFSCKDFDIELVMKRLDEFEINSYSNLIVDRDDFDHQQIVWK